MSERTYLDENGGTSLTSRRGFLTGSAAALAGGALMAVPGVAFAKGNNDNGNGNGDDEHGGKKNGKGVTDIDILNDALTLEHLEAVFYTQGLKKFGRGDFERYFKNNRDYRKQGIKELDGGAVRMEFTILREHEQTHVETLQA